MDAMTNLTSKQELAAQKLIELGDQSKAYRAAYNTKNMSEATIWQEACRLFKNPKVSTRVAELQAGHRKRHDVTVDSITEELEEARLLAISEKQASAAVSATMGKAKIHGHITDKGSIAVDMDVTGSVSIYLPDNGRTKR